MNKQWFVTVGVPGGEYATKAHTLSHAEMIIYDALAAIVYPDRDTQLSEFDTCSAVSIICRSKPPKRDQHGDFLNWKKPITVRPAPFELDKWLGYEMLEAYRNPDKQGVTWDAYVKVQGGWLYYGGAGESASSTFVPVALTAGITVLEAEDD